VKVHPFRHTDLALLNVQPMQRAEAAGLTLQALRVIEQRSQPGITVSSGGEVLACAGIVPVGGPRAILWAFLSAKAGAHMLGLTRIARVLLRDSEFDRVETTVRADFEAGHRFARLAGFVDETPNGMPKYSAEGAHHLYARVR
jgi:hypothetical protein